MKKIILTLMGVMMIMGLVGCGTNETAKDNYYVDANTGEKVQIEINDNKTYDFYASVKNVKEYDNGTVLYQFEYKATNDKFGYTVYQMDTKEFEIGDVVKITCAWNETSNAPSYQDIISVEKK